jgi:hypothetical protein
LGSGLGLGWFELLFSALSMTLTMALISAPNLYFRLEVRVMLGSKLGIG